MNRDEAQYKLWQAGRAGVLNYLRAVKGGGWSKTAAQSRSAISESSYDTD